MTEKRQAIIYRMVLPDHVCPFGVKALRALQQHGFEVDDRLLETRMDADAFKAKHEVSTTPLIFIDGERVGGSRDLERFLASQPAEA